MEVGGEGGGEGGREGGREEERRGEGEIEWACYHAPFQVLATTQDV